MTVICTAEGMDAEDVAELLNLNMKNETKGLEEVEQDGKVFATNAQFGIVDWVEELEDLCMDVTEDTFHSCY